MGVFVLGKQLPGATAGQALLAALLVAAAVAAASQRGRSGARRHRHHDHHTCDPLRLPALLVAAPPTSRFAFARARLARDEWVPAYQLSSGRLWWRCLRLSCSRGELHPCAERLAKHLSWHLDDRCALTDIRAVLGSYAAYHGLSRRTAWTDWGRLVAAGWLSPTRAPANQGPGRPQGPGSGRAARYVLTAPEWLITQLRARSRRRPVTSLDSSSSQEVTPSPSVPPHRQDHQRGWITLRGPTPTQRREASALLAGCHEPWRRQRPNSKLLTRPDWHQLLPLVAQVQAQRPEVALSALLTDRVASARSLPDVLAWRLWRLLRTSRSSDNASRDRAAGTHRTSNEETADWQEPRLTWQQHLPAVRALGGPAAARAALRASTVSATLLSPTSRISHTPRTSPPLRRPPLSPTSHSAATDPGPIYDLDSR